MWSSKQSWKLDPLHNNCNWSMKATQDFWLLLFKWRRKNRRFWKAYTSKYEVQSYLANLESNQLLLPSHESLFGRPHRDILHHANIRKQFPPFFVVWRLCAMLCTLEHDTGNESNRSSCEWITAFLNATNHLNKQTQRNGSALTHESNV